MSTNYTKLIDIIFLDPWFSLPNIMAKIRLSGFLENWSRGLKVAHLKFLIVLKIECIFEKRSFSCQIDKLSKIFSGGSPKILAECVVLWDPNNYCSSVWFWSKNFLRLWHRKHSYMPTIYFFIEVLWPTLKKTKS